MSSFIDPDDFEIAALSGKRERRRKTEPALQQRKRFDENVIVSQQRRPLGDDALEEFTRSDVIRIGLIRECVDGRRIEKDHRRRRPGASASASAAS
jgi:hypothetical protein